MVEMFPAEIVVTGGGVNRSFAEGDKGAVEKSIHAEEWRLAGRR